MIRSFASTTSTNRKQVRTNASPRLIVCVNVWLCLDMDCVLFPSEPQEITGHTSAIKKALWCNNDTQILSAADDKTVRSVLFDLPGSTFVMDIIMMPKG